MKRLAFFVSGGGTDMQSVIDAIEAGKIRATAAVVVSSKPDVYALERAKKHGIPTEVVVSKGKTPAERDAALVEIVERYGVDLIVLAGYLSILSADFVAKYPKRIINIHPALLPAFGGAGMYGMNVHRAVIAAGAKQSGATVHYVDAGTDTGEIIAQRALDVLPTDTPETLQERILNEIEHVLLPEVVAMLCND